ncbi:MAG: methyl-accepting chemotaxis protein [Parcubacteria group bacterium Gr01-1014_31]|nr:MAG: methyl-accepting chemotaxis protein [Parcubacteria group bacterium Gr01-1014_31]
MANLEAPPRKKSPTTLIRHAAIIAALLLPSLAIAVFSFWRVNAGLTDLTLARRQSLAQSAAQTLNESIDRVKTLGLTLSIHPVLRGAVTTGQWKDAESILEIFRTLADDLPIDRALLFDAAGTLQADDPQLPDVIGKNFADRDWYRGLMAAGAPYVSEVYRRAAEPRLNVVMVGVPIMGNDQRLAGILGLQIDIEYFLQWSKNIKVGDLGYIAILDHHGNVVTHPYLQPQQDIVNLSDWPVAQRLARGENDVVVIPDPITKQPMVTAFEPVLTHGWGVLVQQPAAQAFAARNSNLRWLSFSYLVVFIIGLIAVCRILHRHHSGTC